MLLLLAAGAVILAWNLLTAHTFLTGRLEKAYDRKVDPGFEITVREASLSPALIFSVAGGMVSAADSKEPLATWDDALAEVVPRLLLRGKCVPSRLTVIRPTLHVEYQPEKQLWNVEEFLKGLRLTEPRFRELLREGIYIEDATVRVRSERLFGDSTPRILSGVNMRITKESFKPGIWAFSGRIAQGHLRGAEFSGTASGEGLELHMRARRLEVDSGFMDWIPMGQNLERIFTPRGTAGGDLYLSVRRTDEGFVPSWRGRIEIDDMSAASMFYPVPVEDLSGAVEIVGLKTFYRDVTGQAVIEAEGEKVKAPVMISGSTDIEKSVTELIIGIRGMPLTESTIRSIPNGGDPVWEAFRASGMADIEVVIRSEGPDTVPVFTAEMALHDVKIFPDELPFPVENIRGNLRIDGDRVRFTGVSGEMIQSGKNARLLLDGDFSTSGRAENVLLEAENIEFTYDLLTDWPDADAEMLRKMDPVGIADLRLSVQRCDGCESGSPRFEADINLRNTSMTAPGLPLRFIAVRGRVVIDEKGVRLTDLTGRLPQADSFAIVSLKGGFDFDGKPRDLQLGFSELHVDGEFFEGLPMVETEFLRDIDPSGYLEGTLRFREEDSFFSGIVNVLSGRADTVFSPYPIEISSGRIQLDGSTVSLDSFRGIIRYLDPELLPGTLGHTASIKFSGEYDMLEKTGLFGISAEDIKLNEDVVSRIPGWGADFWDTLRPAGLVSLSGSVGYDDALSYSGGLHYSLDLGLRDASVLWSGFPLLFRSLTGGVFVTNNSLHAPNVQAFLCGGKAEVSGFVSGLEDEADIRFNGSFDLQRIDIRKLIREMTGREMDVAGKITGVMEIAGRIGEEPTLLGQGEFSLSEGRIWHAPVFFGLIDILHLSLPGPTANFDRGRVQFEILDEHIYIQHFELRSPSAEMTGWGTIRLQDGELDLTIVAATVPEGGIPLISPVLKTILSPVQRELIRIRVTGAIDKPKYSYDAIGRLTRPAQTLYDLFRFPMRIGED